MEAKMALWLTSLIIQTMKQLDEKPGLSFEVEGHENYWVQIVPEDEAGNGILSGFLLNFAYHHSQPPDAALQDAGVTLPPDTRVLTWEANRFATLWIRPDVPVVALAHFAGDILEKIQRAPAGYQLSASIEHGL